MSKEFRIQSAIQQADELVKSMVIRDSTIAYLRLEKEAHGNGCGCNTCLNEAVSEVNSWLNFVDLEDIYPRYVVVTENGVSCIRKTRVIR